MQWYKQARGAQAPPTTEELDEVPTESTELYRCRNSESLRFPLLVWQSDIKDGIPTEAGGAEEVRGMKGGRLGGPPGMRAEHFKG